MTSITDTLSSNFYSYSNTSLLESIKTSANTNSEDETLSSSTARDTVTLSSQVATARTREALGLSPTGRLTLADFEAASAAQEEAVNSMLETAVQALGIDSEQQVSLGLDNNGDISIQEDFSGKEELEAILNEEEAFKSAFTGLTANSEIINFKDSLLTRSDNLANYVNGDTSDDDLMSLALKYSATKSAGSSLEALLSTSRSQTPYTHVYNPAE
ncbi:hypothetical protein [Desulfospira joergensenii]|uniref:hypothetical protein n=1 Tax=Desulfospira joergensenii TaxID=53329 RepID=UPI0003B3C90E|nr:hypothetical protein [Desulfospira joergensenii]